MNIHNTSESIIYKKVQDIYDTIKKRGNPENICTCDQCRLDVACYALNRVEPHYVISNRGVARMDQPNIAAQQNEADIISLIYEAIKQINHNKRHDSENVNHALTGELLKNVPVFNIPTIVGRLFNGLNFAPMSSVKIELHMDGDLVQMIDKNWQNPYMMVSNTNGAFSFWPTPILAEVIGIHKIFEFAIRINAKGFDDLNHFFKLQVTSEREIRTAYSMERTYKLPDLYLFQSDSDK